MPNDAKLGLVTGLAVVVLIAMTYYRKEPSAITAETSAAAAPSKGQAKETAPAVKPPIANPPDSGPPAVSPSQLPPPAVGPPAVRPAESVPADDDPFSLDNAQRAAPPFPPLPPSLPLPLPPPPPPPDDNSTPALPPPPRVN